MAMKDFVPPPLSTLERNMLNNMGPDLVREIAQGTLFELFLNAKAEGKYTDEYMQAIQNQQLDDLPSDIIKSVKFLPQEMQVRVMFEMLKIMQNRAE